MIPAINSNTERELNVTKIQSNKVDQLLCLGTTFHSKNVDLLDAFDV